MFNIPVVSVMDDPLKAYTFSILIRLLVWENGRVSYLGYKVLTPDFDNNEMVHIHEQLPETELRGLDMSTSCVLYALKVARDSLLNQGGQTTVIGKEVFVDDSQNSYTEYKHIYDVELSPKGKQFVPGITKV